jgi:5-methylthioribose kinase
MEQALYAHDVAKATKEALKEKLKAVVDPSAVDQAFNEASYDLGEICANLWMERFAKSDKEILQ